METMGEKGDIKKKFVGSSGACKGEGDMKIELWGGDM
jgi:hypothetical protein